jgi:hypothetical protein
VLGIHAELNLSLSLPPWIVWVSKLTDASKEKVPKEESKDGLSNETNNWGYFQLKFYSSGWLVTVFTENH